MVGERVEGMPSISGFEFWGAMVVPGKVVKCEITGNILHLTSVAMDENICNDPKQRSVLSVVIDDKQFVLASLREGVCEQIAVDFLFRENKPVKFKVSGKTTLHLVGYLQPLDLGYDDEEISSGDEEDDEMFDSQEEDVTEDEQDCEKADHSEVIDKEREAEQAGGKKRLADVPIQLAENSSKKSKKGNAPEPKKDEDKSTAQAKVESVAIGAGAAKPEMCSNVAENSETKKTEKASGKVAAKKSEQSQKSDQHASKKDEKESRKSDAKVETAAAEIPEPQESKPVNGQSAKANTKKSQQPVAKKAQDSNEDNAPSKEAEQNSNANAFRKLAGGVMVKDIQVGEGKVASKGKRLGVVYKGMLKSGKVFDSNLDSKKPFFFKMGHGDVIRGWDVGFEGMKVGGKRIIVCPPKLAYGKEGSPPEIPPQSVLVFEVELINVK